LFDRSVFANNLTRIHSIGKGQIWIPNYDNVKKTRGIYKDKSFIKTNEIGALFQIIEVRIGNDQDPHLRVLI